MIESACSAELSFLPFTMFDKQQTLDHDVVMGKLQERIEKLEDQLAFTRQQLERTKQASDREKINLLTRLVEVTKERDKLKSRAEAGECTQGICNAASDCNDNKEQQEASDSTFPVSVSASTSARSSTSAASSEIPAFRRPRSPPVPSKPVTVPAKRQVKAPLNIQMTTPVTGTAPSIGSESSFAVSAAARGPAFCRFSRPLKTVPKALSQSETQSSKRSRYIMQSSDDESDLELG